MQLANDEDPSAQSQSSRYLHSILRQLGRCLFMRQLVSMACDQELPVYFSCCMSTFNTTSSDSLKANGQVAAARFCDPFGLPSPFSDDCFKGDPAVIKMLNGLDGQERARWNSIGRLLGSVANTGELFSADWSPAWEILSHDLHFVPHVLHVLSACLEQ
eukprot:scaffold242881_cov49-Prasinocladus_malaysianus.AAC.1